MKDLLIVILSTALFFIVITFSVIGIQEDIFRIPVYYNPNGLVQNINPDFKEFWGQRLSIDDLSFAKELNSHFSFAEHEIRIYDKSENIQIGRFFFANIKKTKIIQDFLPDISISLISFVVGIWFFYYIRDFYIFFFFMGISLSILSNFLFLAFDSFQFFAMASLYFTSFSLFNLSYRFRGKEIQAKWLIPQFILTCLAGFIAQTEKNNPAIILQLSSAGLLFVIVSGSIASFSILFDIFRYDQQLTNLKRKVSLLISLLVIVFVPTTVLFHDPFSVLQFPRWGVFLVYFLFLVSFIYGTYRYSLIPAQVLFNPTIINMVLVGIIVGSYIAVITLANILNWDTFLTKPKYLNIFLLFIIVIYLIQAKSWIRDFINYYSFRKNKALAESLEKISNLISSPISMKMVVGSINKDMMETLGVGKIVLLLSGDQFVGFDLKNINITRLSKNSELWRFFQNSREITVTSHLAYGVGFREHLFNYLTGMEIQIAYPIRDLQKKSQNKAILLIGEKMNKQNFSLGELRYIREVGRLASMLIDNYSLLADEIEKKKIMRSLTTASVLEHTLNLVDDLKNPGINLGFISLPAVEISGDYLDIIECDSKKIAFFIGDVSGHGLGSGYIVTAIKSIIRDMIKDNEDLEKIFSMVNLFLKEKYDGNDFMTMVGGFIDSDSGNVEFINAGHPSLIQISTNGDFTIHKKTQRVLGILKTDYSVQSFRMAPGEKLILYSDGVTETFSPGDQIFGEENLLDFLKNNYAHSPLVIPYQLQETLQSFRQGKELSDDTTFVCMGLVSQRRNSDK